MKNNWLLILGANSDIAMATAHEFAENNWNILLASRDIENLNKSSEDLKIRYSVDSYALYFDATDYNSHLTFYNSLPYKPQGVILAFGYLGDQASSQNNFEEAKQVINVNYTGAVSVLEIIASDFENSKNGFIVGISSVAGERGRASNYIYGSAKAALSVYLGGLRHRLYPSNVNVITVKPGFVATKMTSNLDLPKLVTASPRDVAKAIYSGVIKRKNIIYFKPVWRLLMLIITLLPDFVFKRTKL